MFKDRDFAFLIDPRGHKTHIYIVADSEGEPRVPKPAELYAYFNLVHGKLTVVRDDYDAITQPNIYDGLQQAVKRNMGNGTKPYLVFDDHLNDYMDAQLE